MITKITQLSYSTKHGTIPVVVDPSVPEDTVRFETDTGSYAEINLKTGIVTNYAIIKTSDKPSNKQKQ